MSTRSGESERPGAKPTAGLSARRKCFYAALTVVGFFLLLELVLAAAGVRPVVETRDPFVGFHGRLPLFVEQTDADGSRWLRTAENKLPWFNDQRFPRTKAAGTLRIFCLGGSTTQGQPYDDATSFTGWLRELLPEVDPARRWEVINAGGISYASYRVAAVMQELSAYEPDLFIVYTGHNEFLEERTYGDLRRSSRLATAARSLVFRTRTGAAMERLLEPVLRRSQPDPQTLLPAEVDALLDRSIGPEAYERDDEGRRDILRHFEHNLAGMVEIARRSRARIVFVAPAASLKDCSPLKSQHRAGLAAEELQRWQWLFQRGRELAAEGRHAEAIEVYRQAERIDPRFSEVHYRIGESLLALEQFDEARRAFLAALEEDVCPLRAPAEFVSAVTALARQAGVPVVDFPAIVERACRERHGHAVPGREFFLDHVHPTIEASGMLASALVEELERQGVVRLEDGWKHASLAAASQRIESRLDRRAHAVALRNLAKVLAWAGRHEEAGRLVLDALAALPDDPEANYLAGCYFKHRGELEPAIEHFRLALPHRPDDAEAHQLLGSALADAGRLEEALPHLQQALELLPSDADLEARCGAVLARLERYREAAVHFRRALASQPADADLHYNLGVVLSKLNDSPAAAVHLREAIRLNPADEQARRALEKLRESQ